MATVLDLLKAPAFADPRLTEAINIPPYVTGRPAQLGIFTDTPIHTTYVRIAVNNGEITIIPARERGAIGFCGVDGTQVLEGAAVRVRPTANWGANSGPAAIDFLTNPGGTSATLSMSVMPDGSLGMGANRDIVIDANRLIQFLPKTISTLPAPSIGAGKGLYCSDLGGGGWLKSDGTYWKRTHRGQQKRIALPAGARIVLFSALGDFAVKAGDSTVTAALPSSSDMTDGSAPLINPTGRVIDEGVTHLSFIAPSDFILGLEFYKG